ncbi:MAG: ATP-binding protein [Lachnospiraceae bacterium]
MRRKLLTELIKWKDKENRKPLLLWGARQVGKTWILKEFGRECFKNTVYISFYNNKRLAAIFEQDYNPDRIIEALEIELHVKITPNETLLIFDEIQNAIKVLESLKYFCEEKQEVAVAAAGSLLGVALHEGISFPVGKVDELRLYPMSFQEFLWAMDEEKLGDYLTNLQNPEINAFREKYIELLRKYFVVGGMPEVVRYFRENGDYQQVRENQNSILEQYEGDFGKHVDVTQLPRIRMVWSSLPLQLAKENRKFFFGQIKKGARAKDYEIALQWLLDAGLIYKVYKVEIPGMPLKAYRDLASFKVYFLDVGLLGALGELDVGSILRGNHAFTEFKGALTEQYVFQQMAAETSYTMHYFATEKSAYEVDFLFQKEGDIAPLEVKAEENLQAKSLKMYCEKYKPAIAYRTSMSNYREQDWLTNVPLWAVQAI